MIDKHAVWKEANLALKGQMALSTYDAWLRHTVVVDDDVLGLATFMIGCQSSYAVEWLENRLKGNIKRAISNVVGYDVSVAFMVHKPTEKPMAQALSSVSSTVVDVPKWFRDINWGQIRNRSFSPLSNYGNIFWQAYLNQLNNRAYGVWVAIQTYDQRPDKLKSSFTDFWTPPHSFRIRELTAMAGAGSNTPALTGRMSNCYYCEMALNDGKQMVDCCGHHSSTVWREDDFGTKMCRYWKIGALEILQNSGLLAVQIEPGTTNTHRMNIQVWTLLPVLTPKQLEQLPSSLQIRHNQWLENFGASVLGISKLQWEEITVKNVVSWLPQYHETKELGTYVWNKLIKKRQKQQNGRIV